MKKMGLRIHQARTACDMTQEQVGDKLGVHKSTIMKWEKGEVAAIKRSYIQQMADLFNVKPEWLMGFDEHKGDVEITYSAPNAETVKATVDLHPIIGESSKRAQLYQAALAVPSRNLDIAIELLKSLSQGGESDA